MFNSKRVARFLKPSHSSMVFRQLNEDPHSLHRNACFKIRILSIVHQITGWNGSHKKNPTG